MTPKEEFLEIAERFAENRAQRIANPLREKVLAEIRRHEHVAAFAKQQMDFIRSAREPIDFGNGEFYQASEETVLRWEKFYSEMAREAIDSAREAKSELATLDALIALASVT